MPSHASNQQIVYSFHNSDGNDTRKNQFHQVLFGESVYSFEFLTLARFALSVPNLQQISYSDRVIFQFSPTKAAL